MTQQYVVQGAIDLISSVGPTVGGCVTIFFTMKKLWNGNGKRLERIEASLEKTSDHVGDISVRLARIEGGRWKRQGDE